MKELAAAVLSLLCAAPLHAQLAVSTAPTPTQLVEDVLLGDGVSAFNILYNGAANPPNFQQGRGSFTTGTTNLGLSAGMVLASGAVMQLPGNAAFNMGTNLGTGSDPDLVAIAGSNINDRSVLQFDFIPNGDTLRFRYVFGSEEYPEYVCSFNDAFGFFLSGPGIAGPYTNGAINIARLPNNAPVTINNVNHGLNNNQNNPTCPAQNPAYYVNNMGGATIRLDGFTTVLEAMAVVQCGETYRIKLAIGDALDTGFDSAVFLEAGSFAVTGTVSAALPQITGVIDGNTMLEGCGPYDITFTRTGDLTEELVVDLAAAGTATPGVDYMPPLPPQLIFPPGMATATITITIPLDADLLETLDITISEPVDCGMVTVETVVNLFIDSADPIEVTVPDMEADCGATVELVPTVTGGVGDHTYLWDTNETTPTIVVDPGTTTTYSLTVGAECGAEPVTVDVLVTVPVYPPLVMALDDAIEIPCLGSVTIAVADTAGGQPPYTFAWTEGGTSVGTGPTFVAPSPGAGGTVVYEVTMTDACGTELVESVTVSTAPSSPIEVAMAPYDPLLCVGSSIVLQIDDITGGGSPVVVAWTDEAGQLLGTGMALTVAPGASQTITLTVSDQCGQAEVTTIDLVVGNPANAGTNGVLVTCSSGAPADLFGELGGAPDTGGTWSGPSTIANGQFDPGVHDAGTYTYSVPGEVPCPVQSATVAVTVVAAPDAGGNGYIALCSTGGTTGLINSLEGNPDGGGTWTGPSSINGLFDPALHEPGTYTYTVTAPAPCPSASATVEVEVSIPANAGTDGSAVLCSNGPATALIGMLGGAPQGGGTWSGPGPAPGGSFNPATGTPGLYTYTVQSPAPCPAATATVNMTVQAAPQPGAGQTLALCANQPPVDLYAELNGSPDPGGTWTGPLGVMNGSFNPALGPAGTYTYTVAGVAPCADAATSHTVTVTPAPNAGGSTAILLCPEAAPTDLFDHLAGAPASGGTWTGPGGGGDGTFSPGMDQPGVYTYTVTTGPACPPATATVTVTVPALTPAYAGPDAVICDLSGNLAASDNWASGTWTAPPGIDLADIHSPASGITAEQGGPYTLVWSTVSPDGCTDSDEVQVVLTPPMSATVTAVPATCHGLCNGQAQVQALGGNLDGQGYGHAWSGGTGNAAEAVNICPGEHQVVVTDMNGCAVIAEFTIEQPDPVAIDSIAVQRVTCAGDCDGTLVVTAPHGEAYSLNGGQTWQDAPEFTGLCAGTWTVTVRDEAGCTATVNGQVASPPPTIAAFHWSPHVIYANAPAVQFMNVSSSDAVAFAWDFAGQGASTEASPVFHFPGTLGGTYPVCLQVTNADGCTDLHCREVEVRDVPMGYLPNAFTPDADGLNDQFGPVFSTLDIMDYELLVFDRWSRVAFESTDPLDRWDGTMDGKLVSTGTYVWILRYRADRQSDRVEMRGHVTVVR